MPDLDLVVIFRSFCCGRCLVPHQRWSPGCCLSLTIFFGLFAQILASKDIHFPDSRQAELVRHLRSYEIAIPQRVNLDGSFLTHQLSHHVSRRHIRSTRSSRDDTVHYKLTLNNEEVQMRVIPNHKLYTSGTVIERRKGKSSNVSAVRIKRIHDKMCHFVGDIKGHADSKVALSTCHGLRGFIHSKHGQYFIEPILGQTHANGSHPHLLYKGSTLPDHLNGGIHKKTNGTCGVTDHSSDDKDREKWQQEYRGNTVHNRRRRKRSSYSLERNVEALVVVDDKMMNFYKNEDVETYVLTIMNMVAVIYHDSSIGNAVNVVLVRMILLEEEEEDLKITHHADHTLNSFCKWQSRINPKKDSHPGHHDVAILLTRFNICSRKNQPCSTLGLAQVSGMCQPHRSCNINEDTGLALAYTIAHELGHNFGMKHDGPTNNCEAPYGIRQHVMSPQLVSDSSPLVWSNCSREAITKFLDRDWGYCLEDEPGDHDFEYPIIPPGAMYDADHQCRLQYGPTATHCDGIEEVCTTLWCKVNNKCMTRLEAAAEGTYCDKKNSNKWCFRGRCTTIGERAEAINGEWGEWSSWSECTRTCGAGVSHAQRLCNNPMPSNGGKYCLGERKRFRICNTKNCPEDVPSFRHYQCSEFNTVPYKNRLFTWEPVFTPSTPCQLHCKPKEKFFSVMLKDIVTDGTPCSVGKRDMCISGKCRTVGCDWVIDSTAKEDRCGMCHGDGSTCLTVKKEFTEEQGLGYVEATVIPKDARNIRIEEVAEANNYLALRNSDGKYYLNGHWFIQWSGDYEAAGTVFHYERNGNKEKVFAPGPLKEQLHIMLLFQSQNPGVEFEYTVPNENATVRRPIFMWKYTDWSHCTVSCGGGIQRMQVICVEQEAGIVEDHYCHRLVKPDDKIKACNDHICPATWWIGPWQHCSVTCGKGTHRRTVICVRSLGPDEQMALDDEDCKGLDKPIEKEPCHHKVKCPEWIIGKWSDDCHGDPCATQHRSVKCSDPSLRCDSYTKPTTTKQCGSVHCGVWTSGLWSNCTQPCGLGLQFRRVKCTGGTLCRIDKKPSSQRLCNRFRCPKKKVQPTARSKKDSKNNVLPQDNFRTSVSPLDVVSKGPVSYLNMGVTSESVTQVTPQSVTEKTSQSMTDKITKSVTEMTSQSVTDVMPSGVTHKTLQTVTDKVPEGVTEGTSQSGTDETTNGVTHKTSQSVTGVTPQSVTGVTPQSVTGVTPQSVTTMTSQTVSFTAHTETPLNSGNLTELQTTASPATEVTEMSNHIQIDPVTTMMTREKSVSWEDMDKRFENLNQVEKLSELMESSGGGPPDEVVHGKRHRHRHHRRKGSRTKLEDILATESPSGKSKVTSKMDTVPVTAAEKHFTSKETNKEDYYVLLTTEHAHDGSSTAKQRKTIRVSETATERSEKEEVANMVQMSTTEPTDQTNLPKTESVSLTPPTLTKLSTTREPLKIVTTSSLPTKSRTPSYTSEEVTVSVEQSFGTSASEDDSKTYNSKSTTTSDDLVVPSYHGMLPDYDGDIIERGDDILDEREDGESQEWTVSNEDVFNEEIQKKTTEKTISKKTTLPKVQTQIPMLTSHKKIPKQTSDMKIPKQTSDMKIPKQTSDMKIPKQTSEAQIAKQKIKSQENVQTQDLDFEQPKETSAEIPKELGEDAGQIGEKQMPNRDDHVQPYQKNSKMQTADDKTPQQTLRHESQTSDRRLPMEAGEEGSSKQKMDENISVETADEKTPAKLVPGEISEEKTPVQGTGDNVRVGLFQIPREMPKDIPEEGHGGGHEQTPGEKSNGENSEQNPDGHLSIPTRGEKGDEAASELVETEVTQPEEVPFKWIPLQWSPCTRHCGGGRKTRKVICVETKTTNEVPSANCYQLPKPTDLSKCHEHLCIEWAVSDWSPCSSTCGSGVQKRDVFCPRPHQCDLAQKPMTHRLCEEASCIVWVAGSWSECSKTCDGGEQARHVQCVNQSSYEPVEGCDEALKPLTQQQCNKDKCHVQNAALMDWHRSTHCTSNQMSVHVCTILKRLGHCSQRYVQVKCCRTCRPKNKGLKHFVTA